MVFIFALSASCLATAGDASFGDLKKAAREGMKAFLRPDRLDYLHYHGFESQADLENAVLGEGFEVFTIPPGKLLDESAPLDLQTLVTSTNSWDFLIVVGKKAKAVVTVGLDGGEWMPLEFGSSELADQLSDFLAAWPASSGYRYRFIRIPSALSGLIELSKEDKVVGIVPLTDFLAMTKGRTTEAFNPSDVRDPKEVLTALRLVVKKSLRKRGN
ncbi:MAG TPA: hypothetical protein VI298_04645 [Geobacteraceae bacterium]